MSYTPPAYRHIRLAPPDDAEYLGYLARLRDARPPGWGRRSAGEYLGGVVEKAVVHWLKSRVPLKEERILTWEQRLKNSRSGRLYREIDAIWEIDSESLCLFEIKFTHAENIAKGAGIKQLETSCEILAQVPEYQYLLKRLVYVADEPVPLNDDTIPAVEPDEEFEEWGVIWVSLDAVAQAAEELGLELPENWREPTAREGRLETAAQEEWKQYGETEAPEEENPLAEALRRAMQQE